MTCVFNPLLFSIPYCFYSTSCDIFGVPCPFCVRRDCSGPFAKATLYRFSLQFWMHQVQKDISVVNTIIPTHFSALYKRARFVTYVCTVYDLDAGIIVNKLQSPKYKNCLLPVLLNLHLAIHHCVRSYFKGHKLLLLTPFLFVHCRR